MEKHPFFSIIIPTYNRPKQIRQCIKTLSQLNYPPNRFEVIVVDDGSNIPAETAVANLRNRMNLKIIRQSNAGPAAARNNGAAVAKGRFLAFTDDDCMPYCAWLKKLEIRLAQTPDHLIGGKTLNFLKNNPYSTTSQLIVDAVYAYYNHNPHNGRFLASNNMAVSAELFKRIGGFDSSFRIASEDRELCSRWLYNGNKIVYAPEIVIFHAHHLTLLSFFRQHFNYGRGALQYQKSRIKRQSGRMWNDFKFHCRLLFLLKGPLLKLPSVMAIKVIMLLFLWQISNAAGFFYELCKK